MEVKPLKTNYSCLPKLASCDSGVTLVTDSNELRRDERKQSENRTKDARIENMEETIRHLEEKIRNC